LSLPSPIFPYLGGDLTWPPPTGAGTLVVTMQQTDLTLFSPFSTSHSRSPPIESFFFTNPPLPYTTFYWTLRTRSCNQSCSPFSEPSCQSPNFFLNYLVPSLWCFHLLTRLFAFFISPSPPQLRFISRHQPTFLTLFSYHLVFAGLPIFSSPVFSCRLFPPSPCVFRLKWGLRSGPASFFALAFFSFHLLAPPEGCLPLHPSIVKTCCFFFPFPDFSSTYLSCVF